MRGGARAILIVAVVTALAFGWLYRHEGHLTPETGIGYWLGIIGGTMMLLLLVYPLRKRVKALRWLGSVGSWFQIHMVLGILGPTLVVLHSNFSLNALNSTVALMTMLVVVASGLVGRFLYGKVHRGMSGHKNSIDAILRDLDELETVVGIESDGSHDLVTVLRNFSDRSQPPRTAWASLWRMAHLGGDARRSRREALMLTRRLVSAQARRNRWGWWQRRAKRALLASHVDMYFAASRRAAAFAFYERLLALWHVLHTPLFVLLVLTVTVHIVAVHLY